MLDFDEMTELRKEIEDHWPELDARLGPMSMPQVYDVLCEVTGADVKPSDSIYRTAHRFTEALRRKRNAD